jgi:hypothetical protein
MKYGLWDTKDKCWLGNGSENKGPNLYDDEQLARAAATVASRMLKLPLGRIRALPFKDAENLVYKDQVEAELSCEEAIASLEGKEEGK